MSGATQRQAISLALALGGPRSVLFSFSFLTAAPHDHGPDLGQTYSPRAHKARGPQKQVLRRLRKSQSPMGFSEVCAIHSV
jgi:hypothetical protein